LLDINKVETMLPECSQTHFAKAEGTPLLTKLLIRLQQYNRLTPFGDLVSYSCNILTKHNLDEPTQAILTNLCHKVLPSVLLTQALGHTLLVDRIKMARMHDNIPIWEIFMDLQVLQKHVFKKKMQQPALQTLQSQNSYNKDKTYST